MIGALFLERLQEGGRKNLERTPIVSRRRTKGEVGKFATNVPAITRWREPRLLGRRAAVLPVTGGEEINEKNPRSLSGRTPEKRQDQAITAQLSG
jgi:hypothetical protein